MTTAVAMFVAAAVVATLSPLVAAEPPRRDWVRTETRADCGDYQPLRQPFFGELHIHTGYSTDAVFVRVRTEPRDSYNFARGNPIGLPPYDADGLPTRFAELGRPLDFTAVTDHAEGFGIQQFCLTPQSPGYDQIECVDLRATIEGDYLGPSALPISFLRFLLPLTAANPQRFAWCGIDDVDCLIEASLVWEDTVAAAEQFYDRTAACSFTTFAGYEWTNNLLGFNLHRNIIFRTADVPTLPTSYFEEPTVEGLFTALENECLNSLASCDFVSIPHNSNASGGLMFEPATSGGSPFTTADADRRAAFEPVVEIFQHKGGSECRIGVGTTDELCGFEKINRLQLFGPPSPDYVYPPLNFVRNALKEGLVQDEQLGVNPFPLGFVGGTDGHNSTAGATNEEEHGSLGHMGIAESAPEFILRNVPPGGIETNGGGLTVIWAEENSRDALFAAMRRREVYATSGTRPIVRMFAGRYAQDICASADFVAQGYDGGVPMGGTLAAVRGRRSPRFAVLALKDPGGGGEPSTPLQRIQMVKGWIDTDGQAREKVFEIAGDPDSDAGVNVDTCVPTGTGFDTLCTVWTDPEFRSDQRAFYYARVVENPTCRWTTYLCNRLNVDCADPASIATGLEPCCAPELAKTIQERAWTSPVWYRPEEISLRKGIARFGAAPSSGTLRLALATARVAPELDLARDDLTITLRTDGPVYTATLPAGSMVEKVPGRTFVYADPAASVDGVEKLVFAFSSRGKSKLRMKATGLDLSSTGRTDQRIDVELTIGRYRSTDSRIWELRGGQLRAQR